MEIIFWGSIGLIAFSYAIYPFALLLAVKLFGNNEVTLAGDYELPDVAIVIAAFNEEKVIKARIENLLSLDYPTEKITVYIGSDGSTDETNDILKSFKVDRINIVIFEDNRGKASVLNDLVDLVGQPYIIFSDANTCFESSAIKKIVRHFVDTSVGAVCGELHLYSDGGNGNNKDNIYWQYEQFLKRNETKLDALLGANGAIYAIKSELYVPIPENTIVDDFLIVMNIAKIKYRVIYDTEAIAHEEIAPSIADEIKRRIRIGTGNYQVFTRLFWLLNPFLGWRFFSYISHKVLRWFTPHLMLLTLMSNILLLGDLYYNCLLVLQLAIYCVVYFAKKESDKGNKIPSVVAFLVFFVSMNLALLKGFYKFTTSNAKGTWERTSR